jgi:hypothetical protein
MTSKFEQLIEYVINDEEAKAKELFHDIVVEKSREIYENLMNEEEQDEELDEAKEEEQDDEELDESEELEEAEEELDETFGGDASDELIRDVETEEEGIAMEDGEEEMEFDSEESGEEESGENLEDRVVDLEDKLDELMAEFESLMGDDGMDSDLGGEEGDEVEGDAMAADDTMSFGDEELAENISLAAAPKPTTTEPAGTNTKSTVAFNSGAAGMEGAPVKMTGDTAKGRPAPTTQAVSSDKFQNEPATGSKKLSPAPKPHLAQAAGVNTKTPFPKG